MKTIEVFGYVGSLKLKKTCATQCEVWQAVNDLRKNGCTLIEYDFDECDALPKTYEEMKEAHMKKNYIRSIDYLVKQINFFGSDFYEVIKLPNGYKLSINGVFGTMIYSENHLKERLDLDLFYLL